jgi:hypothetical protein
MLSKRPKRPTRPRAPRKFLKKTDIAWMSEDGDILLSDLLLLIPPHIRADSVRIIVRYDDVGKQHVGVVYDLEVPNTRFAEQQTVYERKLAKFELELSIWQERDREWQAERERAWDEMARLTRTIEQTIDDMQDVI